MALSLGLFENYFSEFTMQLGHHGNLKSNSLISLTMAT